MSDRNETFEVQKMEGLLREAIPSAGDESQVSTGQLMFEMGRAVGMKCSGNQNSGAPHSLRIWQCATAASVMVASLFAILLLQQWPAERNETIAATNSAEKVLPAKTPEIASDNASDTANKLTNVGVKPPPESTGQNTRWLRSPAERYDRLLAVVAGEIVFDSIVEPSGTSTERRIDIKNRMLGPYQSVRKLLESEEL